MQLQIDPRTAVALKLILENKTTRELYDKLIKSYMETANVDENEAKNIIGVEWIRGCIKRAEEMVKEIDAREKESSL